MKETTAGALALTGAVAGGYLASETVKGAVNTVAGGVDSVLGYLGKGLTVATPVLIPAGLAAGVGYLAKKAVGDKVKKGEIDYYGNTAALGAGAAALGTFGKYNIFGELGMLSAAGPVAGIGATLLAGTALYKKHGIYGASLAAATAATLTWGVPYYMIGHLGIYGLDKIGLGNYLRNKFNGIKK